MLPVAAAAAGEGRTGRSLTRAGPGCQMGRMARGELTELVQEKLAEAAGSNFLGQAAIVNKTFVGEVSTEKLLRLTVRLFEAINESLTALATEIDDLGERVARLEGRP